MNRTERIAGPDGERRLRKSNPAAPSGFFAAEAAGLAALSQAGCRVPAVLAVDETGIDLEFIDDGRPDPAAWREAGYRLARLHAGTIGRRFGFDRDTFCGDSRQPNAWREDGFAFYREQRYGVQIRRARDAGLLDAAECSALEALVARLDDHLPAQRPALLHGDLWSGNLMFDAAARPVFIDPACYYGWPEADLAMTRAFGGFSPDFYQAYQAERPLEPGFDARVELYNLYHWLNHLNLFGGAYHGQVRAVMRRYG